MGNSRRITIASTALLLACGSSIKATGTPDATSDPDAYELPEVTVVDPPGDPSVEPVEVVDPPPDPTVDTPPPGSCLPAADLACGSSIDSSNDAPGSTNAILENGCLDNVWTGPEIAYSLTFTDVLRATIDLTGLAADLDLFLFPETSGACDVTGCLTAGLSGETRDERMVYTGEAGETVYILVDGWDGAVSGFHLEIDCVTPEDCDDGLDNDGDTVADCDDPECRWVLPCYEDVCDDGVDNDHDGPADCADFDCMSLPPCPTACTPTATVVCGGRYVGDTRLTGTADEIDRWSCSVWDESGPEDVTSFTATSSGRVTARISGHSVDLDVFVLEDTGSGCVNTNCIAHHNNTAAFDAVAGRTYYIIIDGYLGVSGDYNLEIDCS